MQMRQNPMSSDHAERVGECDVCHQPILRHRGDDDLMCTTAGCPAIYNSFGQRLRDDLHTRVNPSSYDDDIGDLEGDEMSYADREDW